MQTSETASDRGGTRTIRTGGDNGRAAGMASFRRQRWWSSWHVADSGGCAPSGQRGWPTQVVPGSCEAAMGGQR